MTGLFTKLMTLAIAGGLVAGNADEIERLYYALEKQTQYVSSGMDMRTIGLMLDKDYITKGRYPTEKQFQGWLRKNLKENHVRDVAVDVWGTPLLYEAPDRGKRFRLVSAGPDKTLDTEDDLIYTGP